MADRKVIIKIIFIIVFISLSGFILYSLVFFKSEPEKLSSYYKETFPYDLSQPAKNIKLSVELHEISGISYYSEGTLAAIEDEHAILYLIDSGTGTIKERYRFRRNQEKKWDFEDLAVVKNDIYVLASTGKVTRISNLHAGTADHENQEIPALYRVKDDSAEALCYDEKTNVLLLVYKTRSREQKKADKQEATITSESDTFVPEEEKPVFAFDLATASFRPEPLLNLDLEAMSNTAGIKIDRATFKPSCIAIHPLTGDVYLLSAISKQLMVVSPGGELLALVSLSKELFRQPEGMCFMPNGDLIVSSEGVYASAYLLLFPYQEQVKN